MTDQVDVSKEFASLNQEVKSFIQKSNEEAQSNTKLGRENSEKMKELNEKCAEIQERMLEIEQKSVSRNEAQPKFSAGEAFVKSDAFSAMKQGSTGKARIELKNTIVGSDAIVAPNRLAGVVDGAYRNLRVADVIPNGNTGSNSIEYTRENVFTNSAAETAEGAAKPESSVTYTLETAPVATIAHWIKLSKQVMDDAPQIASHVDGRMRYGVQYRLDSQIINGLGTGAAIGGILKTGNFTAFTPAAATVPLENVRRALTLVKLADYMPTAIMMNPADCEAIDLDKATDGHFRAADPRTGSPMTLWGLPVVETNAVPAGKFITGAMDMALQLWNRQGVTVDLSESDDTNFQSNLVTLRAESRHALTIYRPASIVAGNLAPQFELQGSSLPFIPWSKA